MIVLFTDFGSDDIYVAQMKASALEVAPAGTVVTDLLHSVPNFDPRAGAHLLAALQPRFAAGTVFIAVVDPGVGGTRAGAVVEADGRWFVGPDNGLLSVVAERASQVRAWRIVAATEPLAVSFHGRDLFAPIAGHIAGGVLPAERVIDSGALEVSFGPDDLPAVIYVDHYGNALTGLRAAAISTTARVEAGGHRVEWAPVFCEVARGTPFWYQNSIGLVEIAANQASAAAALGLAVGTPVTLRS